MNSIERISGSHCRKIDLMSSFIMFNKIYFTYDWVLKEVCFLDYSRPEIINKKNECHDLIGEL